MKNNSLGSKLLMAGITLALVAYFGFQALRYFGDPLSTTLAYRFKVEEEDQLVGWVVRSEEVLQDGNAELLQLQRAEGERVSVGGNVAVAYANGDALEQRAELSRMQTKLEQLQYAKEATQSADASLKLDEEIREQIFGFKRTVAADQLSKTDEEGETLRALILKRDYTFSEDSDFDTEIKKLSGEIRQGQMQAARSIQVYRAPKSGLYSAAVDGYEAVLTPGLLAEMTPSQLAAVQADPNVSSAVGKLIYGDSWYYAAVMPVQDAKEIKELSDELQKAGKTLTLKFAKSVERELPVTVDCVGPEEKGNCVVTFRGREYLAQLTLLRHQSAQIISNTVEGIRIPKESLRIVPHMETAQDGREKEVQVTGVYCIVGMEARFKPVNVLYSGDGFCLVSANPPPDRESLRLRPGDKVIITAKDLYDGKVIS